MFKPQDGIGERGEAVPGPPWILGHRGSPLEAPENTLSSLRVALDLGLDGVEYDVHACASGEPVLLHDDTLERTTDASGAVRERTLPELFGIDGGLVVPQALRRRADPDARGGARRGERPERRAPAPHDRAQGARPRR